MTRKLKFLFALVVPFCFSQNAHAQFAIGTKMLGLNLGYLSQENGASKYENSSVMVAPEVYFFPSENYAIGGSFSIEIEERSYLIGGNTNTEKSTSKGLSLGARIFTKGEHTFKFYVNPALMIRFTDGENFVGSTLLSTFRGNSGGLVLNSGFVYMVNKKMGLNFNTGPIAAFVGSSTITSGNGNTEPVKDAYTEFRILPNGLSKLTLGFNYFF